MTRCACVSPHTCWCPVANTWSAAAECHFLKLQIWCEPNLWVKIKWIDQLCNSCVGPFNRVKWEVVCLQALIVFSLIFFLLWLAMPASVGLEKEKLRLVHEPKACPCESHGGLTWYSVDRSQRPEYADSADGRQAGIMAVQRILHHPEDRVRKMSEGRQRAELKEH